METIIFEKDLKVFYITATSFPSGILDAHKKLHTLVPFSDNRKYFGISRPENGTIVYRACAEELETGELAQYRCECLILKKGNYISVELKDYLKNLDDIDTSFKLLLSKPGIDPEGYCVEWYINDKDVKCMVRLAK